jgi:lactoylglutathione lyase
MGRPFKVLGIAQVAFGAKERKSLRTLWVDLMGLTPTGTFQSAVENVDEEIVRLGDGALAVEIDLMQPLDPTKKPTVDAPALNHVGFWVDDLRAAYDWLSEQGVRFTPGGIRPGASGHDVCFIHPKGNDEFPVGGCGALIELVQAPKSHVAAFSSQHSRGALQK